jgi:hypothetical protein
MPNGKWQMTNGSRYVVRLGTIPADHPDSFGIWHLAFAIWHLPFGICH